MESFRLKTEDVGKQPVIRVKPTYYQTLCTLRRQTGLPLGNIVEQCMDYALEHLEGECDHADA